MDEKELERLRDRLRHYIDIHLQAAAQHEHLARFADGQGRAGDAARYRKLAELERFRARGIERTDDPPA